MFVKIDILLLCCLVALCSAAPGGFFLNGSDGGFSTKFNNDIWRSDNGRSSVDATAQFSRDFHNNINQVGGGLGYKSPEGSISGNLQHTRGFDRDLGYDVGVQASKNLYTSNNGRTTVDAVGSYSRHHGGPAGTGDANTFGGIELKHKWK